MPDTGAPWNIPYVEATDLVSDWPADSLALANAIDAGLDAASALPIVQIVNVTDTTTRTTSSTSMTDTGVSLTITPTSASNKILLMASFSAFSNPGVNRYTGGSYQIYNDTAAAAVEGTQNAEYGSLLSSAVNQYGYAYFHLMGLDAPASTSAQTYKIRFEATNTTAGTPNNQMVNATTTCVYRAYEVTA
jgi:hypothetical protein